MQVKPKIAIVFREHWSCALLRAALVARDDEASCEPSLVATLLSWAEDGLRKNDRLILIDQAALGSRDRDVLPMIAGLAGSPALMLVTGVLVPALPGPWRQVISRPVTLAALADIVHAFVAEAEDIGDARVDLSTVGEHLGSARLRLGAPWPTISCARCQLARHFEAPRGAQQREQVDTGVFAFALEHASCTGSRAS